MKPRGFTLIELIVTISVLAILLAVAAPSFVTFQRNAELTSTVNDFFRGLLTARAEAMKYGRSAFVQPRSGGDWTTGWFAYVDMDGSMDYNAGADLMVMERDALAPASARITVTAGASPEGFKSPDGSVYVMFNGAGFPRWKTGEFSHASLDMSNGIEARRVISSPAGRIRVCKPSDAGCTASSF